MAKPLVTVADQAFFAASIEKELTARTAWAAKFKHLLERPVRKSHHRPFDLPSIPCEPKDQTGKYAVKRRDYDKEHIAMIDILLADRKEKPLLPVMYPLAEKEEGILAGDKKELLPEIRKMRDNKTEYHDRFRDYGVGEKINRTFVTKSDAAEAKRALRTPRQRRRWQIPSGWKERRERNISRTETSKPPMKNFSSPLPNNNGTDGICRKKCLRRRSTARSSLGFKFWSRSAFVTTAFNIRRIISTPTAALWLICATTQEIRLRLAAWLSRGNGET